VFFTLKDYKRLLFITYLQKSSRNLSTTLQIKGFLTCTHTELYFDLCSQVIFIRPRCNLATCLITNLGSDLQRGDEKTGGDTKDPLGFGKK
uniref:Uncharacterized protein n=1 Tax=Labrus bergylta TaxID=56723 RepID=A0A3Q3NKC3_9LABR